MITAAALAIATLSLNLSADDVKLDALTENASVHGFTAASVYLDAKGAPMGARFVHDKTGFVLDYLRIESAPQGFLWVTTFPTSDKGEPHTQEHLLLGKGDRGRKLGSFEAMELAESSAFTDQWRTCYHFHTEAGRDAFWPTFENQLDALLHPDYTDEEIRREVRNFGVDVEGGAPKLEEKGTVYNEMVRSYEGPDFTLWHATSRLVYGLAHPLAFESGGYPDDIRKMTPADIRAFHDAAYRLDNMGMIGAFPSSMPLADILDHTAALLVKEAGTEPRGALTAMTEAKLPAPHGAPAGALKIVAYPFSDDTSPSPMFFTWPAVHKLDLTERTLLELFLGSFAGDESTTLYKKLIDGKTRVMDLGASGVGGWVSGDQGQPFTISVAGVKADHIDAKTLGAVRKLVRDELARIAQLKDGDPELVAFNERVKSRVVEERRALAKFLDTPPGFGFRGTGSEWVNHLHDLAAGTDSFKKSLTETPTLDAVAAVVANTRKNPWAAHMKAWRLLDDEPYATGAKPSPARRAQLDKERDARIAAELARLQQQYASGGTPLDKAATLARFGKEYDAQTASLEAAQKAAPLPPLVDSAPMTFDDDLKYDTKAVAGVPALTAVFDSMVSARVSLAFRLDVVNADDLFLIGSLADFMRQAGVIDESGKPIAADEMNERLRNEVLELSSYETLNARTGRVELVVAGAGNDVGEDKNALRWMKLALTSPDLRVENLARLRDVVDQSLTGVRQTMLGAEEGWVDGPRDAWWKQSSPLQLHVASFLTREHDLVRLKWRLAGDPAHADVAAHTADAFEKIAKVVAGMNRAQLARAATALGDADAPLTAPGPVVAKASTPEAEAAEIPPHEQPLNAADKAMAQAVLIASGVDKLKKGDPARALIESAGHDLQALLGEVPDATAAADAAAFFSEAARELRVGPAKTLASLEAMRKAVASSSNARIVQVGSTQNLAAIRGDVDALVAKLEKKAPARITYASTPAILARMKDHDRDAAVASAASSAAAARDAMLYVGLVDPATSSGVFLDTAPGPTYTARGDEELLDYLASVTYSGHGAHSMFMKTWAAGLAYSNGLHPQPGEARLEYYAERCPALQQTLRFVIDELKKAHVDDNIARYAVAGAFGSRVAEGYEQRAEGMASDLVDGEGPDVIRGFREKLMALSKRKDLAQTLDARMKRVYGQVLPGLGAPVKGGVYFVIGPESQLASYDDYLKTAVGKTATLHRLYPRDFWVP